MSFSGTLEDVNAALAGLGFSPTADYNGGSTLTITSNDATPHQLNIDASEGILLVSTIQAIWATTTVRAAPTTAPSTAPRPR